ncbi:MAG: hypothetical protein JSU73_05000 [candidate division WOR-3 bacterium]|nr:MAG: hypothetical protein JSU73_05000 [candidate division WOR-3 bacterium]
MAKFLVVQSAPEGPVPPEVMNTAMPAQMAYFKKLKEQGKIESIYAFAAEKGGCGIFEVDSHEELLKIATENPMWPFVSWDVWPLTSMDEAEKVTMEVIKQMP